MQPQYQNQYQPQYNPGMQGSSIQPPMAGQFNRTSQSIPTKKDNSNLIKTIIIIVLAVFTATFLCLFVWMYINWNNAKTDVEGQVKVAVAENQNEIQTKLENEYNEREKYPYSTFGGVVSLDYGSLTFEYPKTWSLYVESDGSSSKDFKAYLNPGQVNTVDDQTIMALRVSILNEATDVVKKDYADKVEDKEMTVSTTVVNGTNVDVYTGLLDSDYQGIVCVFKIRDKTAVIQTDAIGVFKDDFYNILKTIRFVA